ncbi:MarR family winged helix-turn-helix transcriptional regulator [Microbispora bryophytorum]|uniref:MarR family winged helix-turn-helix transcriptional regulator n=1 Tax=Microbispora bryophytorum TaxID=1460882 RepID=UPI0037203D6A
MRQEPTPDGLEALLMELVIEMGLQRGDALMPDLAMTLSEGLALLEIWHTGPVPQQHIVDRLRLEKSSVSRLIAGLERKGWLVRERDQANRRYYRLMLSDAGRAVVTRMSTHLHERHGQVLTRLSGAERSALAVALPALTRALRETTAAAAT